MNLAKIEIGEEAEVVEIIGKNAVTRRLMEMGVVPGVSIKVIKNAPFGDPIQILVRGYNLALRRSEAERIQVQSIKPKLSERKA
jgi:Fe2+ transport system protein FeoA